MGGPGRPRDEAVDVAINRAALELIAEQGLASVSVEAVALRAGVGKTTVYRRWSCKDELITQALATLNDELPAPQGDTTRERLLSLLGGMSRDSSQPLSMRLFPRVVSHKSSDPTTYGSFYERVLKPRRERFLRELRTGVESGELRHDVDLDHVVNLLVGPMLYQTYVLPESSPEISMSAAELVDLVLSGIASDGRAAAQPEAPR